MGKIISDFQFILNMMHWNLKFLVTYITVVIIVWASDFSHAHRLPSVSIRRRPNSAKTYTMKQVMARPSARFWYFLLLLFLGDLEKIIN